MRERRDEREELEKKHLPQESSLILMFVAEVFSLKWRKVGTAV